VYRAETLFEHGCVVGGIGIGGIAVMLVINMLARAL
jgi:hypothetical protein